MNRQGRLIYAALVIVLVILAVVDTLLLAVENSPWPWFILPLLLLGGAYANYCVMHQGDSASTTEDAPDQVLPKVPDPRPDSRTR